MAKTTDLMQHGLSRAVRELRTRMRWNQADLAAEIRKRGSRTADTEPNRETISRWEHGHQAPSPAHRATLAKIAVKYKHGDLAEVFSAPDIAWRLVGHAKYGLLKDED